VVSTTTFLAEINSTLKRAMRDDETVIVIGEDVAEGGPYHATKGLAEEFGEERVINTPISEAAIAGVAVGAAQAGLRPVLEIMYIDFVTLAYDQMVNQAAKAHLMSGGQLSVPMVLRTQGGAGTRSGAQHSQSLEALLAHIPGLKVAVPSNAHDARALLREAIKDPNPVVFIENKTLYYKREEVRDDEPLAFGRAAVVRRGVDATVVAYSRMVSEALSAADQLAEVGLDVEVIDARTLVPFDLETVMASVKKTGVLVVAHEAVRFCGFGAEIAAQVQEQAGDHLDAPVQRIGAPSVPIPVSPPVEDEYLPSAADIVRVLSRTIGLNMHE